jgi:hypothetical protein
MQLNMKAILKLKKIDEIRLAFFLMDFKILYHQLIHADIKRILKIADQADIQLLNKLNKRFHCELYKLAKSY